MATWALVLAAGSGARFGTEKQFELLGGRSLVERSVQLAREVCEGVCIVVAPNTPWDGSPVDLVVEGGATHADSTRHGLAHLPEAVDTILITAPSHPLVTPELARRVLAALGRGVDAAAPMLAMVDAPKSVSDGLVHPDESRATHLAQLPFAIRRSSLEKAVSEHREFREELQVISQIGGTIAAVDGDPRNIHITTRLDLHIAELLASNP